MKIPNFLPIFQGCTQVCSHLTSGTTKFRGFMKINWKLSRLFKTTLKLCNIQTILNWKLNCWTLPNIWILFPKSIHKSSGLQPKHSQTKLNKEAKLNKLSILLLLEAYFEIFLWGVSLNSQRSSPDHDDFLSC